MKTSASNTRARSNYEFWAEEMVDIADDGRNDWMTWTYVDTGIDVPIPRSPSALKSVSKPAKWLMGKSVRPQVHPLEHRPAVE